MLRLRTLPLLWLAVLPMCSFASTHDATVKRGFNVRDLVNLERISSPVLSPDGNTVVFDLRQTDYAANKGVTSLWIEHLDSHTAPATRFLADGMTGNSPAFSPDGHDVYFLSSKSGSPQVWRQPVAGGAAVQVTDYPMDVNNFKLSPDGKSLALSIDVFTDCNDLACTKKKLDNVKNDKATGVIFDRLFIRHWDAWADGRRSQLFVTAIGSDGKAVAQPTLVTRGIDGDVPSKPFGDASEYTWSPDGKSLAFDVRIAGKTEPWSTNFDIYSVPADGSAAPRNWTDTNKAWDAAPMFSHDGKTLFYTAMKTPGFEADRFGIMALDLQSGAMRELDPSWDRSAGVLVLSEDGKTIYTTTDDMGEHALFAIDIATGTSKKIIGGGVIQDFDMVGDQLVFARANLKSPAQLFLAKTNGSEVRQVTHVNEDQLKNVAFGDVERFHFTGWNGDTVYGNVIKPWNFKPGNKYPVVYFIHGGPQGSWLNEFHYRWNPQTYTGQGYAVVEVDFHGSTGYGQAFTDAISQHWGDRPLEDLQKGWAAALQQFPFLNGADACAAGASYGGSMIYWMAGNWTTPASGQWKCLIDHDGVFDNRMMGYATEELWFSEHENGGTPWENPHGYEEFNPINSVKNWKVPMLVIHSQLDFRIPVEQGIAAFTALQRRGIESKYLYFPDESHWVQKPQNSVLWHDTVNAWLKAHLQPAP